SVPLRIHDLGAPDRPREKMLRRGPRSLTDAELVALLLGGGIPGASALTVARRLLLTVDHNLHELARRDTTDLQRFAGVGEARAVRLVAALELGRRREAAFPEPKPEVRTPAQVFRHLRPLLGDLPHEEFYVLCLNRANRLLGTHLISRGGTTATVVDAKQVFRAALTHASVTSLVLAHNHPSGSPLPSVQDLALTRKLVAAARQLDLEVVDHLIVAGHRYFSFVEEDVFPDGNSVNPALPLPPCP
ncbi:MAG: DNA repair protein RadC, partial [Bacteroidota bacterium]